MAPTVVGIKLLLLLLPKNSFRSSKIKTRAAKGRKHEKADISSGDDSTDSDDDSEANNGK